MRRMENELTDATSQWMLLLLTLKALDLFEQMHAYGLARIIEQMTAYESDVHSAATQKLLERLEEIEVVRSGWGLTGQGRRVRFYRLTDYGRHYFVQRKQEWEKKVVMINTCFSLTIEDLM